MDTAIVNTEWLEEHLDDPKVRIVEISAEENDDTYRQGHIPGALRWFWKDACWHPTDRQFVTPGAMAKMLGEIGVNPDTTLVLYGDPVQYGTYAFWALTMAGHKNLKCLDGTRIKWIAENRPLSKNIPRFRPVDYPVPQPDESMRVDRNDVRDKLSKSDRILLDVRSPEEYSGDRVMTYGSFDHGAERKGRIPGAKHLYYIELLNEDHSFKGADEIRRILSTVDPDLGQDTDIVCYCRLSHRATLVWMAFTQILDYKNVKIYDGSWTEWGSIVGFPIEN